MYHIVQKYHLLIKQKKKTKKTKMCDPSNFPDVTDAALQKQLHSLDFFCAPCCLKMKKNVA